LEGLFIALLIAALSGVFSGKNKNSQKKKIVKPVANRTVIDKNGNDNKNSREKASVKPKQKAAVNYSLGYTNEKSDMYKIGVDNIIHEEADDIYDDEILDIGLSDLQRAIVMTEVLGKPVALRKK